MRVKFARSVVFVLLVSGAGCSTSKTTLQALEGVQQALAADEQIIDAYHRAVMEAFDQAREAHVAEAKWIAERLASEGKLTSEAMQQGAERLRASLAEIERRRAKFVELRRRARQNYERALEALAIAADGIALQDAAEQKIRGLLRNAADGRKEGESE